MAFRRAPVRPFPAFVGEARWPWWHPVFWLGTVLQIVATVLVASRVQQWADAQESYVSAESTMWWGFITLPIALLAVVVAAVWTPGRPRAAPHVLWRAALNCLVLGFVQLIVSMVADIRTDGEPPEFSVLLVTGFALSAFGFLGLGILLMLAAVTVDAQRRKGRLLRPWDLAALPGAVVSMIAFVIFGALAAISFEEGNWTRGPGRSIGGVADIVLTMVGASPPARPGWLVPTWIAFVTFVVCGLLGWRLNKRIPDL